MEFTINRDIFLKTLGHANGIIEKKTTLPILSNILIEAKNSKIRITATDLDIVYFEEIAPQELKKEGSTTTSSSILYDILRKLKPAAKVELSLINTNKLKLSQKVQNLIYCVYRQKIFPCLEKILIKKVLRSRQKNF